MKQHLKHALKFLLRSLWCLALCAALLFVYHAHIQPAQMAQLDALEQRLLLAIQQEHDERNERLDALSKKIQTITEQLDEHQAQLEGLTHTQNKHSTSIDSLSVSIDSLELDASTIAQLEKRLAAMDKKLSIRVTTPTKAAVATKAKTPVRTTTKKAPVVKVTPPPFVLFDVQKRGTVTLAIVGQPTAKQLSDLTVVRQGEAHQGWSLRKVSKSSVVVRNTQGQEVTLEVVV